MLRSIVKNDNYLHMEFQSQIYSSFGNKILPSVIRTVINTNGRNLKNSKYPDSNSLQF
jgi:hypothetical protein